MIKVLMFPHLTRFKKQESGIRRVVEMYFKYLPQFDIELVPPDAVSYDLVSAHAGVTGRNLDVCHCHGLYWTADYQGAAWEYKANSQVVDAVRHAREVTVPSSWVAETFQRDMHMSPTVVPHGIDWEDWQHDRESEGYVLWNKNRTGDVCDPSPVTQLAERYRRVLFMSTFAHNPTPNVKVTGVVPHQTMREYIQSAGVYLATTKETFGIGILEAMASGVPVLGYRHGGVVDLVQHGVNGYLAEPGNLDDLCSGLEYCFSHRDVLGQNGRELSREFTWEEAVRQVARVYQKAVEPRPPTVAIIIPTYNYADRVGRAIDSARHQTYSELVDIIVVDDGSNDDGSTQRVVKGRQGEDDRITYRRQRHQGVAIARNTGIGMVPGVEYVCCLDADDGIEPGFLETVIPHLEEDRSIGIAYTGLKLLLTDGRRKVSKWPGDPDYDQQVLGHNQIPTCCVFRREVWERLGGFRQRYAPRGCGSEDAEFWLRAGAAGWGYAKTSSEPLFLYTFGTGMTTSDPKYEEVDWLFWHPWTRDGEHPFASIATPEKQSHPVRQYDQPVVSVVVPVGPGHEDTVLNSIDSLESQTFRQWECIVVDDTGKDLRSTYGRQFPFVKWVVTSGRQGAGYSRNRGVEISRGPLLVFLDADDWLHPTYLEEVLRTYDRNPSIVYTDYIGKATISSDHALKMESEDRLRWYDRETGDAILGFRSAEYDCELAQNQPSPTGDPNMPFYHWCLVTCLIPREWHDGIGGFDESMTTWEDIDYHWRMARRGRCYTHLEGELIVYDFTRGHRRESSKSRQTFQNVVKYIIGKYQEDEVMPCRGCGGGRSVRPQYPRRPVNQSPRSGERIGGLFGNQPTARTVDAQRSQDENYVLVKYIHPNRGTHLVYGAAYDPTTGERRCYGSRVGGGVERFLVHRDDVWDPQTGSKIGTYFDPVPEEKVVPRVESTPRPVIAPEPIRPDDPVVQPTSGRPTPEPIPILGTEAEEPVPSGNGFDLQAIPGITHVVAESMTERGIKSREEIVALGVDGLQSLKGCGPVRAEMIIEYLTREEETVTE